MPLVLQLGPDVSRAHHAVLDVGPRLAREGEGLLHVEGDDLGAPELEEEVAQGAHRDLARGAPPLVGGAALALARVLADVDLRARLGDEGVHEVVGLHAEALAPGHLHRRLLLGDGVPHRARGGGGEHDLLVGQVMRPRRGLLVAERGHPRLDHALRVGLADVDHVVDVAGMAEARSPVLSLAAGGGPEDVSVVVALLAAIAEVAIEVAHLPELVRDVLARVGDGPVGPDDDLVFVTGAAPFGRRRLASSGR